MGLISIRILTYQNTEQNSTTEISDTNDNMHVSVHVQLKLPKAGILDQAFYGKDLDSESVFSFPRNKSSS